MGIRVKSTNTREGDKFLRELEQLAKNEVRVGFQAGKAQEEGTDMVDIAMWNEMGTSGMPARPFMRQAVDNGRSDIAAFMAEQKDTILNGGSAENAFKQIGLFVKDIIQVTITEGSFVPNAPSTIKKKGSSKPLIDTGRMRQSVDYVVKKKGEA